MIPRRSSLAGENIPNRHDEIVPEIRPLNQYDAQARLAVLHGGCASNPRQDPADGPPRLGIARAQA